jgi:DNA-binding beta-propeller fold protein YncE
MRPSSGFLKSLVFLVFLVLSLVAGRASFEEMTVGAGSRDSSGDLTGESLEVALVANVVDGTVSVIDLDGGRIAKTLDITPDGKRIGPMRDLFQWLAQDYLEGKGGLNFAQDTDLSRDGRVLFVSRGFLGDVAAFDIASGELLWRTPTAGLRADHMTISADGKRLYVSALIFGGNRVEVLDTASGLKLDDFRAGQWPHDVHTSADGGRIYVASLGDMTLDPTERGADPDAYRITVADGETLDVIHHLDFDAGVRPFAVSRDESRVFFQLSNQHSVLASDLVSGETLARLELPVAAGVTEADWDFEAPHHGLALSPDGSTLCLAGRASDYAAVVDAHSLTLLRTIPVGDAPSWAAFDEAGELCILPNTRSDDVSIVDLRAGRERARIQVGRAPKHVTVGRVPRGVLAQAPPMPAD